MIEPLLRALGWMANWPRYCTLLVLLFVVRGLFVLSVLPPLEGWDEYQHVAYITFLLENDRPPVLGENHVPRSLYADLVKYPHPPFSADQLRAVGARSYQEHWLAEQPASVAENSPDVGLYQAQQTPLYYRLVAPLYAWAHRRGGLLLAITVLRLMNLAFGAAAMGFALWAIGSVVTANPHRQLLGLLITLQPLFLVNCLRVANDALAVLLGTTAVAVLLVVPTKRWLWSAVLAGALLGFGILAKATTLALVPAAVFMFLWSAWQQRLAWGRSFGALTLLVGIIGAICYPTFRSNFEHYGMLSPMQEAVTNRAHGRTTADLVRAAGEVDWFREISRRFARKSLWSGGWSFLPPARTLVKTQLCLVCASAIGACFLLSRRIREKRTMFRERTTAGFLVALSICITASLSYQMLHSSVAFGSLSENIRYAAVGFPWMLCLFYQGLLGFPVRRLAAIGALALGGVFIAQEIYGTLWQMPQAYASCGWGPLAHERLATLHLSWLGPGLTPWALGAAGVLLAASVLAWSRAVYAPLHHDPAVPVELAAFGDGDYKSGRWTDFFATSG